MARSIPTTLRLPAKPNGCRTFPWRFTVGERVHILGRPIESSYEVVGGELCKNWPHLHIIDEWGAVWRIPQIRCSSKPITLKRG